MIERQLVKLRLRDEVSAEEEQALRAAMSDVLDHPADKTIIRAGEPLDSSTLLLDGLMCRYKDLQEGSRQVTELHVGGDFVDLHAFTLKRLDHNIMTLTKCRVGVFPHDRLKDITERFPHLTRLLWFSTNLDAAIHREWELSLGRRNSAARIAHLFCELFIRMDVVGLTQGQSYDLNLTQGDLAECLGLTAVHVNRTLQDLRAQGLFDFKGGRVTIHDFDRLRDIAEFDPSYLYLERRAR